MDPLTLALILLAGGMVLLVGDLFLPTGGVMSLAGVGLLATSVIVCFTVDRWLGLAVLVAGVVVSPVVGMLLVRAWKQTPVGRAMILTHAEPRVRGDVVRVGQIGKTLTSLRPMGECEFEVGHDPDGRVVTNSIQCTSEFGDLPPDVSVRVTHFKNGMATVRGVADASASHA